jgi:hypothetical protein
MGKKQNPEVEAAIRQLETAALNFAYRATNISMVRAEYIRLTQEMSQSLRSAHANGEISAKAAAQTANAMRNEIMEAQRVKSADIGKAMARQLKSKGVSFDAVLEKSAQSVFKKPFTQLNNAEQTTAYMEVVASAGRARPSASRFAARAGVAGRALFVLGIGLAVYNIANAEDKSWQTGREIASISGGFAGSVAAGALAGIWFGPLGVAIGAFVGGVAGALISDGAYVELAGPQGAFAKSFLPRFTSAYSTDEDGIANALYVECGINMDQVLQIFKELDASYSTDADDVAVIYLQRAFRERGRVYEALKLNQALRQLLIDILEDGYTGSAERQLINGLLALK